MERFPPATTLQPVPRAPEGGVPRHEHQALWFTLARRKLASVVLVPADEGRPVADVAHALAEVGRRLGDSPVTSIVADVIDYDFVARTAALLASTRRSDDHRPGSSPLEVIVAVHSVLTEPLGLALVQAAGGVVLCVELGRTRLEAARQTIELVGRERIVGSVVVP